MEALNKLNYALQPLPLSLHHRRPSPFSSLSFKTPPLPLPLNSLSIKSSSKPQRFKSLIASPFARNLLKTTFITGTIFFARFNLKPLIAAPIPPPATVESITNDSVVESVTNDTVVESVTNDGVSDEEREKNPNFETPQSLKTLMESKIKNRKIPEAIQIIEKLINLEPNDPEWPLLKSHMHIYNGDLEIAKSGFDEIISNDPLRVDAYHGLVLAASQAESIAELKEIEKKIEKGMEVAKSEKKEEDLRDFKLLLAQIRVSEGEYDNGLKIYNDLVNEDPRDFRPYLCQGIIYTVLRKKDEAEQSFQKYRKLVPKGHPYASFFDDNMMATKLFSQKVENEREVSRN